MDTDVSYENVIRFPALAYATGKNRELLNLASMGRLDLLPCLPFDPFPCRWCFAAFAEGSALFAIVVRYIGGNIGTSPSPTALIPLGRGWEHSARNRSEQSQWKSWRYLCRRLPHVLLCHLGNAIQGRAHDLSLDMDPCRRLVPLHRWCAFCSISYFYSFLLGCRRIRSLCLSLLPNRRCLGLVPCRGLHIPSGEFQPVPPSSSLSPPKGLFWLSLLLIPVAIAIMDIFIDKAASLIAPSSQHQLHEILNEEAAGKKTSSSINFFFQSDAFVEKEVHRASSESFVSGFISEDGVKLSTTPSDDGGTASWRE